MIEAAYNTVTEPAQKSGRVVLTMRKHKRMAGSIPVWERQDTAKDAISTRLSLTEQHKADQTGPALSYAENSSSPHLSAPEEFTFGDLLDMINPLQHIPIINHIYRDITGDEAKPISKIIGGTLYGGPAGGAAGLVNVMVEYETGKDITDNVMAMVTEGKTPTFRQQETDHPENRINKALAEQENHSVSDLPGSTLSFAALGPPEPAPTQPRSIARYVFND